MTCRKRTTLKSKTIIKGLLSLFLTVNRRLRVRGECNFLLHFTFISVLYCIHAKLKCNHCPVTAVSCTQGRGCNQRRGYGPKSIILQEAYRNGLYSFLLAHFFSCIPTTSLVESLIIKHFRMSAKASKCYIYIPMKYENYLQQDRVTFSCGMWVYTVVTVLSSLQSHHIYTVSLPCIVFPLSSLSPFHSTLSPPGSVTCLFPSCSAVSVPLGQLGCELRGRQHSGPAGFQLA